MVARRTVVCPACRRKTRAGRTQCPHCEAALPTKAAAKEAGELGWQLRPIDITLVAVGIVALVFMNR